MDYLNSNINVNITSSVKKNIEMAIKKYYSESPTKTENNLVNGWTNKWNKQKYVVGMSTFFLNGAKYYLLGGNLQIPFTKNSYTPSCTKRIYVTSWWFRIS